MINHYRLQTSTVFKVDFKIKFNCDEMERLQPLAMSLKQSLKTFQVTNAKVDSSFAMLIAKTKQDAQEILLKGIELKWMQESYVRTLATKQILPKVI